MVEFWVECKRFPRYSVSNYGQVRNNRTGRDVRSFLDVAGYRQYALYGKYGYQMKALAHELVAEAFFANYRHGMGVTHENGVLHDDSVVNLSINSGPPQPRRRLA